MRDSYKKYTAYNIAIFLIMSASIIAYYMQEKYYLLIIIGMIVSFILIYKQNQLVRLEGIDPDSLFNKYLSIAFVVLASISGSFLNRYIWAVVLLVSIFAIEFYLLNKAFKERLDGNN